MPRLLSSVAAWILMSWPAVGEESAFACVLSGQPRDSFKIELVLDTKEENVKSFAFWSSSSVLFWGAETIFFLNEGGYSNSEPQFALAAFNSRTLQVIVKSIAPDDFEPSVEGFGGGGTVEYDCWRSGL